MKHSALIGKPTQHSVSHKLFPLLAQASGVSQAYEHIRLDVERGRLQLVIHDLRELGFIGVNVTLPYKRDIMAHLDRIDPVAQSIGAVNTIKLGDELVGFNTDWTGIREAIKAKTELTLARHAIIFGTGGAARAAIQAAASLGAQQITVLYREPLSPSTEQLASEKTKLHIQLRPYADVKQLLPSADLVINATSAGMVGKATAPFDTTLVAKPAKQYLVFMDAVFNPLDTPLLKAFQLAGADTVDGLWMMIFQAVSALNIWTGQPVKVSQRDLSTIHADLVKELKHV